MAKEKEKSEKPRQADAQQAKAQKKEASKKDAASAPPRAAGPQLPAPPARLALHYRDRVVPELMKKFGYRTVMQVPRIKKITLNMGVGETVGDKKVLDHAVADMTRISGQKPVITKTRKSIANFKVRAGYPVGCTVTLRGARMYEFLDRLVNVAIPRIRDFRGVSNRAFDGRGSYSLGVKEQIIFPEIEYDKIDAIRGMDIAINTSARTDDEARALLAAFRFPFRQEQQVRQEQQKG
ncbi:MAG: 50S ribosomal protein L5 [Burkholderiales bacterium]|nr:50S ribosomal protein L5 [Burkholderiales bacterium]